MRTRTELIELTNMSCGECGIVFAVPEAWRAEKQRTGMGWCCPNGHRRVYIESDVDRLKREVASLRSANDYLRQTKESIERSRAAIQGQLTKERKRTANGVCPCCNRSFANLHRHMQTKHPDFPGEG